MFDMMSLSNDETERNTFFAQTLENSRVLIYLIFNGIQTSFSPCLIRSEIKRLRPNHLLILLLLFELF